VIWGMIPSFHIPLAFFAQTLLRFRCSHQTERTQSMKDTVGHVPVENVWREQTVRKVFPQIQAYLVYVNHFQVSP